MMDPNVRIFPYENQPFDSSLRLKSLRNEFKNSTLMPFDVDIYIVPNTDAHMSEYISENDKRLEYISGFTGSVGVAVITESQALLFTDGKYIIQARSQLDGNWTVILQENSDIPSEVQWIIQNMPKHIKVGADPKLFTYSDWIKWESNLAVHNIYLKATDDNLVDWIVFEQDELLNDPIQPLPLSITGESSQEKLERVRNQMKLAKCNVLIVSALDDIAWLLNARCKDIEFNPVFFSFLYITDNRIHLFINECKVGINSKNHFNSEDVPVIIENYDSFYSFLEKEISIDTINKVWLPTETNYKIYSLIPSNLRYSACSPIKLLKNIKNSIEVKGMINSHIRDGVALCRFFSWLEEEVPLGGVTEISAASQLEKYRKEEAHYVGLSFPTISASGPNGAIIHYVPTELTDRYMSENEIYLCDSGAQYLDGTTDVTRTVHFGEPTDFEKDVFTRVLKGQIAIALMVFPNKIKGNRIDCFARQFLWSVGMDYLHGTGHGIGHYLNVHEGPSGIGFKSYPDDPGLQVNMFMSNEPGFYLENNFGVRLENIVQIIKDDDIKGYMDEPFLKFKTITLCPMQGKMIESSLLTQTEIAYINTYHKECFDILGPILQEREYREAYDWLKRETAPIKF